MTAVGLQTVQLIDSRNCDDMRQHSSTMRLARMQLIEKKWNLVDNKGRLFLDEVSQCSGCFQLFILIAYTIRDKADADEVCV